MKCPIDDTELVMAERHGVEIDYCPKCRGVWLDRGELDKIIDKAAVPPVEMPAPPAAPEPAAPVREYREPYREERDRERYDKRRDDRYRDDDYYRGGRHGHGHRKRKRHKSFLSEIFDFD